MLTVKKKNSLKFRRHNLKELEELTSDHITGAEDVKARMAYIAQSLDTYGKAFKNLHGISFAALEFAFENSIITPLTYIKKVKSFTYVMMEVLGSKWLDIAIKSDIRAVRAAVLKIFEDVVKCGGGEERNMIGDNNIVLLGEVIKKVGLKYKDMTSLELDQEKVTAVLSKM